MNLLLIVLEEAQKAIAEGRSDKLDCRIGHTGEYGNPGLHFIVNTDVNGESRLYKDLREVFPLLFMPELVEPATSLGRHDFMSFIHEALMEDPEQEVAIEHFALINA